MRKKRSFHQALAFIRAMNVAVRSASASKETLQHRVLVLAFVNLLVVALLGLLLRAFPFFSSFPLSYKNMLHGHSHFAFGGWVIPVLFALVMRYFPLLKEEVAYRHWRNIAGLFLFSAYGMLVAFPLQGYKAVSISFSTLSVAATVYFAAVVWKASKKLDATVSMRFLKWGLLYGVFSSLGPFALGPLMVMGKSGSYLYFDAIYFYLHFQYNGFFVFMVLALLYRMLEKRCGYKTGQSVFFLLTAACVPAYALSVLWHKPPGLFYVVGGFAAMVQLLACYLLWKDVKASGITKQAGLLQLSLAAFFLKSVLQFFSAFPIVAALAYEQRNLVIAYLHLVLLGCISLFVFGVALRKNQLSRRGVQAFLFSFFTTEALLVLNAFSGMFAFSIPYYLQALFMCSVFFPVGIGLMIAGFRRNKPRPKIANYERLLVPAKTS